MRHRAVDPAAGPAASRRTAAVAGHRESGETSDTANGELPEETAGPYPGDGSNGANVLTESGVVRSDITSSFGSSTTKAEGIPLTVTMTINDFSENKSPLAGGAVYLWHCNRDGQYSLYSQGITGENYLRGVQETDDKGQVKFTTILPACYDGRWPHIHFEVYPSLAKATNSANKIATSQMALPEDIVKVAYATAGYEQSVANLSKVTLAGDNVFGDGYDLQIPTMTGDPTKGYALTFAVRGLIPHFARARRAGRWRCRRARERKSAFDAARELESTALSERSTAPSRRASTGRRLRRERARANSDRSVPADA